MDHQTVSRLLLAALSGRSPLLWGCYSACSEADRIAAAAQLHSFVVANGYQWPDGNHDLRLEALEFLSAVLNAPNDASVLSRARAPRCLAAYLQVHLERLDAPVLELADTL